MKSQNFPASYHQERLWFIDNFEKGSLYKESPVYHNIPLIVKINGKLDLLLVEKALNILVARHESLRTKIVFKGDIITQIVEEDSSISLTVHDKHDTSFDDENIFNFYYELIHQPFSIDSENLFRAEWIELADDLNTLIFTAHHIISDRKSMYIILEEFASIYNLLLSDSKVDLEELPIQYADFANWQKEFSEEMIEQLMVFWRGKLNFIEPIIFHTDQIRKPIHIFEAGIAEEKLQKSFFTHLDKFKDDEYTVFFTAFEVLMHKYSGQNKIVIGTLHENRDAEGVDHIVGPVSNLLIVNNEISNKDKLIDVFSANESNYQRSLDFSYMPFDRLVTELNPEKDMSRTALFDVLFHYEDQTKNSFKYTIGGIQSEIIDTNLGLGKYDFNLLIIKKESGYTLHLTYNKLYYNESTAQRILKHYITLIENFKDENVLISELEYVTEAEKIQLKSLLDKTNVSWPKEQTLVSLFETQVEKQKNKTALIIDDLEISYQDLNAQSNQFANFLFAEYDIAPQSYIALLLPRNEQQIIAILAVLKLGSIYVPIDQEYPQERINYILDDCSAEICIDEKMFLEFWNSKDSFPKTNLNISVLPTDLSYVIYTSGSTGKPKGVMIEHQNVVRLFINDSPLFDFNENDVWTLFHSYCFDFSVWEMYGALLFGGSVVIIPKNVIIDGNAFLDVLCEKGVTVLNQTPSAFNNLLAVKPWEKSKQLALRCIIFGGEALHPGKLKEWYQFFPDVKLVNMYGITETTVHVTYKEIKEEHINSDICNVGIPIPTVSCFVLDSEKRILPKLIPGELWVGGEGLSRGYLNLPELTNERFILNPYGEGRLYSSGDIVRLLSNDELEYIGRSDNQVKVRGFRIELGEIEKALLKHHQITEVVTTIEKNRYDDNEIVAYFTSDVEQNLLSITTFLQSILPYYMIPSNYVQVNYFQLNNNGKIDKSLLPDYEKNRLVSGKEYVAPRNETEYKLVEIWEEVLGVNKVGITDNFFELGGHSLMAAQVINRTTKQLGKNIPVKMFFANPTIAGIQSELNGHDYAAIPKALEALSYPLTTSQERLWIVSQLDGATLAYNMPAVVKLKGNLDLDKFEQSFKMLIKRHEVLRTYFKSHINGEIRQYILSPESIDFGIEIEDYRSIQITSDTITDYLQKKNSIAFNLEQAPLVRGRLLRLKDMEYIFFLSMHHIIGDGWSIELLISEIIKTYNYLVEEKEVKHPVLDIQYKDYALWVNDKLQQQKHKVSEEYWLEQFRGELPVLDLPSFKPRPSIQTYNGDSKTYQFSKGFLTDLKKFSVDNDVTLFMTLMTGITALLHRYTGQNDIILGTPVAGREHPDLENQIGLYLNTLAIRTKFEADTSFLELLTIQKENLLEAYEHQGYPLDELIAKLNLKRDISRSPLFDVIVVLQNQSGLKNFSKEKLTSLEVSGYDFKDKTSQFDISFNFFEAEELTLTIRYNTDIYDNYIIERIFTHLENLLIKSIELSYTDILKKQ